MEIRESFNSFLEIWAIFIGVYFCYGCSKLIISFSEDKREYNPNKYFFLDAMKCFVFSIIGAAVVSYFMNSMQRGVTVFFILIASSIVSLLSEYKSVWKNS